MNVCEEVVCVIRIEIDYYLQRCPRRRTRHGADPPVFWVEGVAEVEDGVGHGAADCTKKRAGEEPENPNPRRAFLVITSFFV